MTKALYQMNVDELERFLSDQTDTTNLHHATSILQSKSTRLLMAELGVLKQALCDESKATRESNAALVHCKVSC